MMVYYCRWDKTEDTIPGQKGRLKTKGTFYDLLVLCRGIIDASRCFKWYFYTKCEMNTGVSLEDGTLSFKIHKLDSRNFNAHYMQMDGISEPVCLTDLKASLIKIYRNQYGAI